MDVQPCLCSLEDRFSREVAQFFTILFVFINSIIHVFSSRFVNKTDREYLRYCLEVRRFLLLRLLDKYLKIFFKDDLKCNVYIYKISMAMCISFRTVLFGVEEVGQMAWKCGS